MPAHPEPPAAADALARGRAAVDRVDAAIVTLVAERVRLAEALGAVKRGMDAPIVDEPQEGEVLRRAAERAHQAGVEADAVQALFRLLIDMARRAQGA